MQSKLQKAVAMLKQGELVAFPTETVYGLGGDALNPHALKKIFAAKGRPIDHPLIVHIAHLDLLPLWAVDLTPAALKLAEAFWPGPLTLILKKAPHVLDLVTGGQATIGVRIPNHPVANALLREFGSGLAGPSANRFGRISPTSAEAVHEELGGRINLILDGGPCAVGVESTIVDVTMDEAIILRPGMITFDQIAKVIPGKVSIKKQNSPRVSGSFASHYAPQTKTTLVTSGAAFIKTLHPGDLPCALLLREKIEFIPPEVHCMVMPNDPHLYARDLYRTLRLLDNKQLKQIVIEQVPDAPEWLAIQDRLQRACSLHIGTPHPRLPPQGGKGFHYK